MKNKKLLLIILGVFSLLSLHAMSILHLNQPTQLDLSDIPPNLTEIELSGSLDYIPGPNTIEAYADANYVYIYFHQNYGYVNILIRNEFGNIVYNDNVNTAIQQTCIIPLTNASSGNYTITLSNADGYLEGDF